MNLFYGTQKERKDEMLKKEVLYSPKGLYSRYGRSFGKGEVESSNLFGSTINSITYVINGDWPIGSVEPFELSP